MKEISILYLLKLLKKNLLIIILSTVVFGAATFSYCHFLVSPRYSATASIIISNGTIINSSNTSGGSGKDLSSDINASIALAKNCIPLLQSPSVYKLIAAESNIDDYNKIRNSFRITTRSDDMMIIDVTATAGSPKKAVELVNNFTKVCPEYISNILKNALASPFLEAEGAVQVAPRTSTSTMVGAIVGFIVSVLVFLILDMFDQTIHTEDDIAEHFTMPIIGVIPDFLTAPAGGYNDGDN